MPDIWFDLGRLRGVIFDVDGTLYRQRPVRRAMSVRMVRAHLGCPRRGIRTARVLAAYRRAQEQLRSGHDHGHGSVVQAQLRLAASRTRVSPEEVARSVTHWMEELPLDLVRRHRQPGLCELLGALRSSGVRLAVLSDYRPEAKLDALGVRSEFDVVLSASDPEIAAFKPSPRGLEVALERLGVAAGEALYVGDRVDVDAAAAAAARVPCVIVGMGHGVSGCDHGRVRTLAELRERLGGP